MACASLAGLPAGCIGSSDPVDSETSCEGDPVCPLAVLELNGVPHLAMIDQVPENEWQPLAPGKLGKGDVAFRNAVSDFYLTNPIARASEVMAELSMMAKDRSAGKLAAE